MLLFNLRSKFTWLPYTIEISITEQFDSMKNVHRLASGHLNPLPPRYFNMYPLSLFSRYRTKKSFLCYNNWGWGNIIPQGKCHIFKSVCMKQTNHIRILVEWPKAVYRQAKEAVENCCYPQLSLCHANAQSTDSWLFDQSSISFWAMIYYTGATSVRKKKITINYVARPPDLHGIHISINIYSDSLQSND